MPFEIPESWEWVLLPDVCLIPITDGTHQTPTYCDESQGIPFLSSKDVTEQCISWDKIKYITKDLHETLSLRIKPQKFDILLAKNGTTGVAAIVEDDKIFDIYVTLALLRPSTQINPYFLLNVINSKFCKTQFDSHLTGIGLPNLHLRDINKTLITLPPIKEQHRIITELSKWLNLVDIIEKDKDSTVDLVQQAKSKILSLAIQGKLVDQDSSDEPASDMLKRINPDWRPCDTSHFRKLPSGWSLCRLKDICTIQYGYPFDSSKFNRNNDGMPLVRIRDVVPSMTETYTTEDAPTEYLLKNGDMLIGMDGNFNVNFWQGGEAWLNQRVCKVFVLKPINETFIFYLLPLALQKIEDGVSFMTVKHLSDNLLKNIEIPLPPLNEQKRIVEKVEGLFKALDAIQAELTSQ